MADYICHDLWAVHSGYTVGLQHTHRTNRKLSYPSQMYPSKPAEQFEYSLTVVTDCSDHPRHAVNSMQWTAGAYPCGYSLNTHWIIVNATQFHCRTSGIYWLGYHPAKLDTETMKNSLLRTSLAISTETPYNSASDQCPSQKSLLAHGSSLWS